MSLTVILTTDSPLSRASENATEIVSTLVTGIWLAALFTGQNWWFVFMLIGYIVIIPITALLFGDRDDINEWWNEQWDEPATETTDDDSSVDDDALSTLRDRYARGELTDEQFERKVEKLLETDTIENLEDFESKERISERE